MFLPVFGSSVNRVAVIGQSSAQIIGANLRDRQTVIDYKRIVEIPVNSPAYETVSLRKAVLSRLGVFYVDLIGGDGFADGRWLQLGRETVEMRGDEWLNQLHPGDRDHAQRAMKQHLRGETGEFKCEFRVRDSDGAYRWFISSGIVERRDRDGTPMTIVGHNEDVTNLHVLREALQRAHQLAEDRASEADALRTAGAVVVASLDAGTAVRSVVEQLRSLVPHESAMVCEVENRTLRLVGTASDAAKESWRGFARRQMKRLLKVIQSQIPQPVEEPGESIPHRLVVPLVARGSTVGILAIGRASAPFVTEEVRVAMSMADYLSLALSNARLYSRMQQRAEIDQLSGVLTRRAFMESAEQVIDLAFHTGKPLCCLILDLDHFKSINDTYGHPVGDQVIRTLGSIMRDSLRSADMVGRFGGEEFCALLTKTVLAEARVVVERLRVAIGSTAFPGVDRQVTASIGISALTHRSEGAGRPIDRLTIEQIIKRADIALYRAKESGRDRAIAYEDLGPDERAASR